MKNSSCLALLSLSFALNPVTETCQTTSRELLNSKMINNRIRKKKGLRLTRSKGIPAGIHE